MQATIGTELVVLPDGSARVGGDVAGDVPVAGRRTAAGDLLPAGQVETGPRQPFGNLAKKQIAETGERGIELANAAVVVGWVLSILMLAFLTLWCLVFGSMMAGFFSFFGAWASAFPR